MWSAFKSVTELASQAVSQTQTLVGKAGELLEQMDNEYQEGGEDNLDENEEIEDEDMDSETNQQDVAREGNVADKKVLKMKSEASKDRHFAHDDENNNDNEDSGSPNISFEEWSSSMAGDGEEDDSVPKTLSPIAGSSVKRNLNHSGFDDLQGIYDEEEDSAATGRSGLKSHVKEGRIKAEPVNQASRVKIAPVPVHDDSSVLEEEIQTLMSANLELTKENEKLKKELQKASSSSSSSQVDNKKNDINELKSSLETIKSSKVSLSSFIHLFCSEY